jgi:hypothetical protein
MARSGFGTDNWRLHRFLKHDPDGHGCKNRPAGRVDQTTLDALGLEVGRSFGHWFDVGYDWWHQIDVTAIEKKAASGKYPKVTKQVGNSPPQCADELMSPQQRGDGLAPQRLVREFCP